MEGRVGPVVKRHAFSDRPGQQGSVHSNAGNRTEIGQGRTEGDFPAVGPGSARGQRYLGVGNEVHAAWDTAFS
jgi:hypothetical protein